MPEASIWNIFHHSRAIDALNRTIRRKSLPTRLQRRRKDCGITQRELSEKSGVNLRTIQQYERRSKDINKAAGATLRALSIALSCRIEDLLEYHDAPADLRPGD